MPALINYTDQPEKLRQYYFIGDVSKILGEYTSCVRFWIKEHRMVCKINRRRGRYITPAQVEKLRRIRDIRRMPPVERDNYIMDLEDKLVSLTEERKEELKKEIERLISKHLCPLTKENEIQFWHYFNRAFKEQENATEEVQQEYM